MDCFFIVPYTNLHQLIFNNKVYPYPNMKMIKSSVLLLAAVMAFGAVSVSP